MIDIKVENNIFKISNQDLKANEVQWRKTPGQINRDHERQQQYFEKRRMETNDLNDVPLVNGINQSDLAHKVILKDISTTTSVDEETYLPIVKNQAHKAIDTSSVPKAN